ncbi:chitin synthase [Rhizoctonia solani AG-1 IB]|uniref:chitin synthase n=2 Tax=Thanatephorus cucumeris (strain AG1-IB / isolate 7/3/14) TaxID=1108050 RepID=A0A0B7FDQ1_THACB|nr:chitin synthase [Rhizoctonia solani AG-1 IB]
MSSRPPRAAPPRAAPTGPPQASVSFSRDERTDHGLVHSPYDEEHHSSGADMRRKKSLVRPDREKIEPGHRQWHYRSHVADGARVDVMPSATGNVPTNIRRGKSLLGRDEEAGEGGLFKRHGNTLKRRVVNAQGSPTPNKDELPEEPKGSWVDRIGPGPKDCWFMYCYILTCCVPKFLLSSCGIRTPEQQRAWREKMGLIAIIMSLMGAVGFITFGFTQTVCSKPPPRVKNGEIESGSLIIHGYAYDLANWTHPRAGSYFDGNTSPLYAGVLPSGGMDASFLFQNPNENCAGLLTVPSGSGISVNGGYPNWVFPCNIFNQYGTTPQNLTGYTNRLLCHTGSGSRPLLDTLKDKRSVVYYDWSQVMNTSRNLAVYESNVLDLNLLRWLDQSQITYPQFFTDIRTGAANATFQGRDITMHTYRMSQKRLANCLKDLITVGFIDTSSIGCVASEVVLYVSLVFIIGVVSIKFAMAVIFGWFISWRLGSFGKETYAERMQRSQAIENWTDDIYRPAPGSYRPNANANKWATKEKDKKAFLPSTSRFSRADNLKGGRPTTTYGDVPNRRTAGTSTPSSYGKTLPVLHHTPPDSPAYRESRSSASLPYPDGSASDLHASAAAIECPFPLTNVIPQPPPDFEPFNFPLAHTICLVTAYSESVEGLRTTLDSLATTDYPNSHKLILVIADGLVKGSGNDMTTPDIVLSMMTDLVVPREEVEPHSYVAIAHGHKRHNMAKVYAGFYKYDSATVERSKQQKVPIVLVAKCGNPLEAGEAKPGNRGKRDSQIVLMAFLQKVMFDERMTTFEYEFFNSIWRVTGVSPDRYEIVLCVDADTKVFPDSLTRMVSCMVHDEEIMGLCGETKIANKAETWVTMIQVFEYYISHHLTKAFESMFGGVTCLPGCFSIYRIKAPKGQSGYWVPILANPDIVEHYSENIVDTLHKKNLLLLGEDRYLTTLMLKTFPKRKMVFCPQAVCKTIVPDTFSVLLSQRRRWINSTIHNLAELVLVRDLCGTFCFSMQFVVFMELAGTLVLPAAISFTLYLIIITILPETNPKPVIPLILLGIILGLPGLLIVITSRKVAYLGWMIVYLFSLPIWNFVLPAYAFWHFDDFSWGQTRMVAGEKKEEGHGDKDGEFDSSHIVMKRWAEFERDRRFRLNNGNLPPSRDSYDMGRSSPKRESNRYSAGSTTNDGYSSNPRGRDDVSMEPSVGGGEYYRPRDNSPLVMLPAPLAVASRPGPQPAPGFAARAGGPRDVSPASSASPLTRSVEDDIPQRPYMHEGSASARPLLQDSGSGSGDAANWGPGPNPYRWSGQQDDHGGFFGDGDEVRGAPSRQSQGRGVSLVDHGPITNSEGVKRISKPRRQSTQPNQPAAQQSAPPPSAAANKRYSRSGQPQSPASSSSGHNTLPPGAAPPNPSRAAYGRYQ